MNSRNLFPHQASSIVKNVFIKVLLCLFLTALYSCASVTNQATQTPIEGLEFSKNYLSSWENNIKKKKIIDFLARISNEQTQDFVPIEERIAVLDLDGTLIVEKPDYIEVLVAVAALKNKALSDTSLKNIQPYKAAIQGNLDYFRDWNTVKAAILTAAEGETVTDYKAFVRKFLLTKKHKRLNCNYGSLFYKPMVELIGLLQTYNFSVYVVSTSQQEYIRAFSASTLNIMPTNVIGSMVGLKLSADPKKPSFMRTNKQWLPYNAEAGKAERIKERVAHMPILAAGNSSGDLQMLQVTDAQAVSMVLLIDHDDPEREYEYHKEKMLKEAQDAGWEVISMKQDWAEIYIDNCGSTH